MELQPLAVCALYIAILGEKDPSANLPTTTAFHSKSQHDPAIPATTTKLHGQHNWDRMQLDCKSGSMLEYPSQIVCCLERDEFRTSTGPGSMSLDDILCIAHEPQVVMNYLASKYALKKGSVKEPDAYLGTEVKKWTIDGAENPSKVRWAMLSDLYVKRVVTGVERKLEEIGKRLSTKVSTPMSQGYKTETDTTPELDAKRANCFQELIGVLRWI